jgi:hypothetical protein
MGDKLSWSSINSLEDNEVLTLNFTMSFHSFNIGTNSIPQLLR